jgi:hypothetical protein
MAAHSPETTREREAPRATTTPHDGRAPATTTTRDRSGGALAAMIVGIVSIPAALIAILGVALGIVAIVLGVNARRAGAINSGQAMAGIVCGSIGLLLGLANMIAGAATMAS